MQLVYFAAVREALGKDGEVRVLPPHIATIAMLLDHLTVEHPDYAGAFADRTKLRFAVDQVMAKIDAPLLGVRELAIFPPVTGG